MRLVQARALWGQFWYIIYNVWWFWSASRAGGSAPRYILVCNLQGLVAPECVSCRRERSNAHFDTWFTMFFEVLGVFAVLGVIFCVSCRPERSLFNCFWSSGGGILRFIQARVSPRALQSPLWHIIYSVCSGSGVYILCFMQARAPQSPLWHIIYNGFWGSRGDICARST